MSKYNKELAENEGTTDLATESAVADSAHEAQLLARAAAQTEQDSSQTEQSRQFNSWLDNALPRLLQYLSSGTTSAVTSPSPKAKH